MIKPLYRIKRLHQALIIYLQSRLLFGSTVHSRRTSVWLSIGHDRNTVGEDYKVASRKILSLHSCWLAREKLMMRAEFCTANSFAGTTEPSYVRWVSRTKYHSEKENERPNQILRVITSKASFRANLPFSLAQYIVRAGCTSWHFLLTRGSVGGQHCLVYHEGKHA